MFLHLKFIVRQNFIHGLKSAVTKKFKNTVLHNFSERFPLLYDQFNAENQIYLQMDTPSY